MSRLAALLVLAGSLFLVGALSGMELQDSVDCYDASCHVLVSSSLPGVLLGPVVLFFLLRYPRQQGGVDSSRVVGVWRRFGAFCLDCYALPMTVAPLLTLPHLLAEARYTGAFHWSFERDFARPDDWLYAMLAAVAASTALVWYFYRHGRAGRPTLGQYIMGYRIVADPASGRPPEWGVRVLFAIIGICSWPVALFFALRKPNKAFWWDAETGTAAVRVAPGDEAGTPRA